MSENKVANRPIQCKYFKVLNPDNWEWYPHAVATELVDKKKAEWDEEGRKYKEITKDEYEKFYTQITHLP